MPLNPIDVIANAALGPTPGVFLNSSTFVTSGSWTASTLAVASTPNCSALGLDNLQMVADANQWNMQHLTYNGASTVALPLRKLLFLRGGTEWQMNIPLNFGAGSYPDIQISFRDNAATRGDYRGQIPVISFTGPGFSGNVSLQLTLKQYGHMIMGIRTIDSGGNYAMYESEWIIVP
jgi:hypothetical protein